MPVRILGCVDLKWAGGLNIGFLGLLPPSRFKPQVHLLTMDSIDVKAERPSTPVLTSTKEESTTPAPSTPTPRPSGPQLISHLPRAEEEARKTFIELDDNVYQYKTLGLSKQAEEGFTCDCTYEIGSQLQSLSGTGTLQKRHN